MSAELRIDIDDDNPGDPLSLRAPAGANPAVTVIGKTTVQAMALLPLLFNLCPSAHRLAAAMAMEAPIEMDWPRHLLRDDLREQALVILRDWSVALRGVPDADSLRGLSLLRSDQLPQLAQALQVFGNRAISVVANWNENWGYWDNQSLLERMEHRLAAALMLCDQLRLDQCGGCYGSDATGEGWALAARGRLVHRAVISNGRITAYSIDTPTERMIRDGSLKGLLVSAWRSPVSVRKSVFDLALACANPCVAIRISSTPAGTTKGGAGA
ncbi:hypothetical protein AEAC466_06120 [Asticcacaulis sp. AC466]|uniref:hypothetical protein n=1 Tax=Asticcacaulis sp. AC466 TaxID=1282362 RepID=UPI0003C40BFB|nr:hypothetical protein [Asticcacaulis sp. AC466]ESQ85287.1 hypothetical protein AEAC466_06120 [Asticcacaulis sp. AC466]